MRAPLASLALGGIILPLSLALPTALSAQSASSPVTDALRASLQRAQSNFMEAARSMPADKYSFKPTPEQMTFGKLVLHVAGSNEFMCSTISGAKAPEKAKLDSTDSKDKLVGRLEESFAYCNTALARVDDSKLSEVVPFFGGRRISRGAAVLGLAEDWGDHYGAAAVYLRLNGILPPTAKRGEK
jgi:uncharacterized damage-inducible protein DinB